jgi:hypothetical protein
MQIAKLLSVGAFAASLANAAYTIEDTFDTSNFFQEFSKLPKLPYLPVLNLR